MFYGAAYSGNKRAMTNTRSRGQDRTAPASVGHGHGPCMQMPTTPTAAPLAARVRCDEHPHGTGMEEQNLSQNAEPLPPMLVQHQRSHLDPLHHDHDRKAKARPKRPNYTSSVQPCLCPTAAGPTHRARLAAPSALWPFRCIPY